MEIIVIDSMETTTPKNSLVISEYLDFDVSQVIDQRDIPPTPPPETNTPDHPRNRSRTPPKSPRQMNSLEHGEEKPLNGTNRARKEENTRPGTGSPSKLNEKMIPIVGGVIAILALAGLGFFFWKSKFGQL